MKGPSPKVGITQGLLGSTDLGGARATNLAEGASQSEKEVAAQGLAEANTFILPGQGKVMLVLICKSKKRIVQGS